MMRKRGAAMLPNPFSTLNQSRMTFLGALIVLLGIIESRGDYMMGGHLDNKEEQVMPVMEHRSDDGIAKTSVLSSRTANLEDLDPDFDLELDLLAEQSAVDPTRISVISSSSSSSISSGSSPDDATSIGEESETAPRYRVLPYAFNGGHPFSLEKDPITGQIDFEKAPPLKALKYTVKTSEQADEIAATNDDISDPDSNDENDQDTPHGPNEINPYSPSFHDFLNLPVRYTYDKLKNSEKYPLISNSYASTKVQSGSSVNTYNHKKYHEAVKSGVDVQSLYVQPLRKTYIQSITKSSTTERPSTSKSTTTTTTIRPKTTTMKKVTTTTTTTTPAPPETTATVKTSYNRYPTVTTWKPERKTTAPNIHGIYDDYEGTLPIEKLQQSISGEQTSTEKSRYASPPSRPKPETTKPDFTEDKNVEYEEGYDEDYDRILQIAKKPSFSQDDGNNDSQDDYTYGGMDFLGDSRPMEETRTSTASSTTSSSTTSGYTSTSATEPTSRITTINEPTTVRTIDKEERTTTLKPSVIEEKRVTSMPIDTIQNNDDYRISGMNYGDKRPLIGTIDNSIPSVTSNNVHYQHNRPSTGDNYYQRPQIGMPPGGIVVQSTSNVVIPPGQDTVSFVLGNRQSVGSVSDAGNGFYGIRAPSTNDRSTISFGKIGNSRPVSPVDNYSGQMIVSAGIGVGNNPISPYHQRPSNGANNNFDHAVVTVGMPTVDIVNPGESGATSNANKNPEPSTNSLNVSPQKWWTSTGSSSTKDQQALSVGSDNPSNQQFGYRVVFPDEKGETGGSKVSNVNENSSGTQTPIEEHVIVVNESELGNGNTFHLDLSSQSSPSPTALYHYESTTQRFPSDDKSLPELSESLTPPAERPNILPSGIQRPPSYNYYHHQSHLTGNSRPNDYRDQRLPQRLPSPSPSPNGFKRRPASPTIESNLPNILPQFRPNAKTSHGHNRGETIGTIPAGVVPPYANNRIRRPPGHPHHHHRSPTLRRPSNNPPHLQRLNPPPLPPPPPPITSIRLPTPASLVASPNLGVSNSHESTNQNSDVARPVAQNRLHKVTVGVPPSLAIDERHRQSNGFANNQQIKSRLEDETLERFSVEPPARPPYFTKRTTIGDTDGIPRIATLQMIQQHGGSRDDDSVRPNLPPPYRFNERNSSDRQEAEDEKEESVENGSIVDRRGDDDEEKSQDSQRIKTHGDYIDADDAPVYVVYPVKGALDIRPPSNDDADHHEGSVVLGTYGSQRPLPPDTLLQDSDGESGNIEGIVEGAYGHSSIVNVSPSFAESSGPQLASDFPYPLERPDPSMFTSQLREKPLLVPSDHRKNVDESKIDIEENGETTIDDGRKDDDVIRDIDRDTSINVIPYLQDHVPFTLKENSGVISATLHRLGASSSIVSASSTPIAYVFTPTTRTPVRRNEESHPSSANFERGPILLPSQQPSSSSSSAPSPQSFMAPFVASASAEAPTKNGWSVVMMGQSPSDDQTSMERHRQDNTRNNEDANEKTINLDKTETTDNRPDDKEMKINVTKSSTMELTKNEEIDVQTEKSEFDIENFTPQLFGGFRPIFEFPSDGDADSSIGDGISEDTGAGVERPRSETG